MGMATAAATAVFEEEGSHLKYRIAIESIGAMALFAALTLSHW
jgi:hypothetical protein